MRLRPRRASFASVLACLLAVGFVPGGVVRSVRGDDAPPEAPAPPAPRAKDSPPVWRDEAVLAARLTEALDAVEQACGAKYERRPRVRISTREDVGPVLLAELAVMGDALGTERERERLVDVLGQGLVAKYDLAAHVVHVIPSNVESIGRLFDDPGLVTEGVLRTVLVHECTHALDFPRFGWQPKRALRTTQDEQRAFGAIVEGHAQHVARQVAASWGLSAEFERFTKTITAIPAGLDEFQRIVVRAIAAEAEFAYGAGERFIAAVEAKRGRAGLEAVLADPPRSTRPIEHPEEFFAPAVGATLPLDPAFAGIEAVARGPGWSTTTAGVLEGTLTALVATLPEADRVHALDGFREGRMRNATRRAGESALVGVAIRFETPEQARHWLGVERQVAEGKDARMKTGTVRITEKAYEQGAGVGGALEGFVATKTVAVGAQSVRVVSVIFAAGEVAFELVASNVEALGRAQLDAMASAMAAYVLDPKHPVPALPTASKQPGDSEPAPATPRDAGGR